MYIQSKDLFNHSLIYLVLFLLSQADSYTGLVIFCIFFGMSYGMVGALQFEVLMAIVGTEKFSSAIGLVLLMEAIAVLVGPPGAGQSMHPNTDYCFQLFTAVMLQPLTVQYYNMLPVVCGEAVTSIKPTFSFCLVPQVASWMLLMSICTSSCWRALRSHCRLLSLP